MPVSNQAIEHTLRTIFRRCVQCPDETPSCPSCGDNEYCSQVLSSCTECASAVCVNMDGSAVKSHSKSGPNVGAIVGGVVGGVAAVCIITFLIWWFYVRKRRQNYNGNDQWSEMDVQQEKQNDFTMRRDARASTHTVASMASTVLTRASNIIQIAYIPGVTNRSNNASPGMLVPPVPPIPSAHSGQEEQHFFVPGDLRDSTYSGMSGFTGDGRSSYARTSITPSLARSSVATTIYRNNAVISPLPAQTIVRGKAAVVSVKSSSSSSPVQTPSSETPPVPAINFEKLEKDERANSPMFKIQMPSSSEKGSIKSVATMGKPTALNITRKNSKKGASSPLATSASSITGASSPESAKEKSEGIPIMMRPLTEISINDSADEAGKSIAGISHLDDDSSDDDEPAEISAQSKNLASKLTSGRDSEVTEIQDTPSLAQSPFNDTNSEDLSTAIQKATKRASQQVQGGLGAPRARSPFGDEHAVKD